MGTIESTRRSKPAFRNVDVFFILVIAAAVAGFFKSYSAGVTFTGKTVTTLVHVHNALMVLWLGMLVTQASLIRMKRFALHRWIGRSSFIIVPLIVAGAILASHESLNRDPAGITIDTARLETFTWGQLIGFAGAWGLAMIFRRNTPLHIRFMVSTVFAIGTAIVARIFISWVPGFDTADMALAGNWVVLSLLLLGLISLDWRQGIRVSPFWFVMIVIAIMHIGYWTFGRSDWWVAFVEWYAGL